MSQKQLGEAGFSHVETALLAVIVVALGLIGWYVYHANQTTNSTYNAISSNSPSPNFATKKSVATGDTSNANLTSDLQTANSSANQGDQDLSASSNSLNDQSTLTSVPQ